MLLNKTDDWMEYWDNVNIELYALIKQIKNNKQYENAKDINYEIGLGTKDFWEGAYFMSFSKNKQTGISGGTFIAETIHE